MAAATGRKLKVCNLWRNLQIYRYSDVTRTIPTRGSTLSLISADSLPSLILIYTPWCGKNVTFSFDVLCLVTSFFYLSLNFTPTRVLITSM